MKTLVVKVVLSVSVFSLGGFLAIAADNLLAPIILGAVVGFTLNALWETYD